MPTEETAYSSREPVSRGARALSVPHSRHVSRRKASNRVTVLFYALLVLVNFAILSLFGPGGLAGDLVRLFRRDQGGTAVVVPAEPGQFPPGENWDTGAGPAVRAGLR